MIQRTNEEILEFFGITKDDNYYFNMTQFILTEDMDVEIFNSNLYSGPNILILGHLDMQSHILRNMTLEDRMKH